jgi:hypothetical protein
MVRTIKLTPNQAAVFCGIIFLVNNIILLKRVGEIVGSMINLGWGNLTSQLMLTLLPYFFPSIKFGEAYPIAANVPFM